MCIDTTPAAAPKTARSIGWETRVDHATGIVHISQGGEATRYFVSPTVYGNLIVKKLDSKSGEVCERYVVAIHEQGSTCTCKGFRGHGHCKHASGFAALAARNAL